MTSAASRLILALTLLAALPAHADGFADLKAALQRLQATAPISASVDVSAWRRSGDGADAEESSGEAGVTVEQGPRGMQVLYAPELLGRLQAESRAHAKDRNSKQPLRDALRDLEIDPLRNGINAAAALAREIEEGTFKGETIEPWQGKPARRLAFEMPIERLAERDRKYIKRFEARLDVWIAADGTPLASALRVRLSGRAFLVVGFEQQQDFDRQYSTSGDRLLLAREEAHTLSSGAGEKQETRITRRISLRT